MCVCLRVCVYMCVYMCVCLCIISDIPVPLQRWNQSGGVVQGNGPRREGVSGSTATLTHGTLGDRRRLEGRSDGPSPGALAPYLVPYTAERVSTLVLLSTHLVNYLIHYLERVSTLGLLSTHLVNYLVHYLERVGTLPRHFFSLCSHYNEVIVSA